MWNNDGYPGYGGGYGPPSGPPGPPGPLPPGFGPPPTAFPSPNPPPGNAGYTSRSYAPSYGPPPGHPGYALPPAFPGPGQPYPPPGQPQPGVGAPYPPPVGFPSFPPPSGPPPIPARGGPPPMPQRLPAGPPPAGFDHPGQPAHTPHLPPAQQQYYGPSVMGPNHQSAQPWFQYSQCTGKKKALCIGINYVGQQAALQGCINDARNVQTFLQRHYGYKSDDIVMLTDDSKNPRQIPTRRNIIEAMQWLVRGAQPNDSLFFHYSGHGGQTKDKDGDEADGFDEVIYPLDFQTAGHIVDDLIHDIMVKPLPPGCRLTSIFDSCHSGSALDLPYIYTTEGKIKEPNLAAEAGQGLLSAVGAYAKGDMAGVIGSVSSLLKVASGSTKKAEAKAKRTKTSPADVISWSGCKDSQTSADTVEAGQATGAMSFAFMSVLTANRQQSFQELLNNIREILKKKYSQKPQLSSSHPMDTSLLFIC